MQELVRYIHMKSDERILGDGDFTQPSVPMKVRHLPLEKLV